MGNGIAHVFAIHGFNVKLFDIHKESLDRAIKTIEKNMSRQVEKEILTATEAESSLGNIELINEMNQAVESADLVIEAATENEDLKSKNGRNGVNSTEHKKSKPKNNKNDQKYESINKIVGLGEHTPGFLSQSFSDRLAS